MARIGGALLQAVSGWDLMLCIGIVTAVTALYTMSGGIRAAIATDALQFGLFSIIIPIMLIVVFFSTPEPQVLWERAQTLTSNGFSGLSPIQIIGIFISFLLGETLIPPYANRALAAKGASDSKRGFLGAGIFGVVWLVIVVTLGVAAHNFVPEGTLPDDVFLTLGAQILPHGALGLLLAALIAIVMSSQDSVMNAGAVSFVRDLIGFKKDMGERRALRTGRIGTVIIALLAAVAARYSPSIIDGLLILYSIWAPALLLPLLIGLFRKETVHAAGWASMLTGGLTSILWQTVLRTPGEFPAILAGLFAGLIAYLLGSALGKTTSVSA